MSITNNLQELGSFFLGMIPGVGYLASLFLPVCFQSTFDFIGSIFMLYNWFDTKIPLYISIPAALPDFAQIGASGYIFIQCNILNSPQSEID
jgi:hypothetical protein